jgi:hypothetical protein
MNPSELEHHLSKLLQHSVKTSVMIWGPPGIGKSSIVESVTKNHELELVDLRLSQLAPTDLRGLPVAEEGVSKWFPPEFLPTSGTGVLFLDEINMAPPSMQGVAQQLILDRRVGSYELPDGWFVWAAGNQKQDRASVFDMPAPLSNRFIHLFVEPHLSSYKQWGLNAGVHEHVLALLSYRTTLLHKIDPQNPNWPSPRSWCMASDLHAIGLDVESCVGPAAAAEFNAFVAMYDKMPDVDAIVNGKKSPKFPAEPSMRYAMVLALVTRSNNTKRALNALRYLVDNAQAEWTQLFAADAFPMIRARGGMSELAKAFREDTKLQAFMADFRELIAG